MANSILLPYTINKTSRTPKQRHWRRYTTTISSIHINNQQIHSSLTTYSVHKSTSNLPDIVNDCYSRENDIIEMNQQMKLTCKQIAHSLRIVADQVDKKYCQVSVNYSFFMVNQLINYLMFVCLE